jgi:hypothetical protein
MAAHCLNMVEHERDGGHYSVWQGEELVKDGLALDRAKRVALSTQGENGRPIETHVERV